MPESGRDKKTSEQEHKPCDVENEHGAIRDIFEIIREIYNDIMNSVKENSKFQRPPTG